MSMWDNSVELEEQPDDELRWLAFLYAVGELDGAAQSDFEQRLQAEQSAREAVEREVALLVAMRWAMDPAARQLSPASRSDAHWLPSGSTQILGGTSRSVERRRRFAGFAVSTAAAVVVLATFLVVRHDQLSAPQTSDATGVRPGAQLRHRADAASLLDDINSLDDESLLDGVTSLDNVAVAWVQTRHGHAAEGEFAEGGVDGFSTYFPAEPEDGLDDGSVATQARSAMSSDLQASAESYPLATSNAEWGQLGGSDMPASAPHWLLAAVMHAPPSSGYFPADPSPPGLVNPRPE